MELIRVKEFTKFLVNELLPGVDELEGLSDKNRKHIQKLVYTNLVDRFDYMVDKLLLENCREDVLISKAFSGNDKPVTESDLVTLLINSDNLQEALNTRLQDKLRISVLRQRHSRKLSTFLNLCSDLGEFEKKPRVNPSKGEINDSFKVQNKKLPHSICGYADWLYSRRNAIVHGAGGSTYLDNDKVQIKKLYKAELTKTFKVSLSSIRIAATFYQQFSELILENG